VVRLAFFDTDEFVFPASVRTLAQDLVAESEPIVRDHHRAGGALKRPEASPFVGMGRVGV
jgi:hypothetical protein